MWVMSGHWLVGSSAQGLIRQKPKCWLGYQWTHLRLVSSAKFCGCWQDSVSCGCRTEVLGSREATQWSQLCDVLHSSLLKSNQRVSLMLSISLISSLAMASLKGLTWYGLPRTVPSAQASSHLQNPSPLSGNLIGRVISHQSHRSSSCSRWGMGITHNMHIGEDGNLGNHLMIFA